ncbi:hypothetical protein [Actinomadura formosensis]|uniref:hypothetical protein n=1 Tax=Actinomadura formosensis TaxID=60706 RepID=UPI003D93441F
MVNSIRRQGFDSREIEALPDWHIFNEHLDERECPHCRSYYGWTGPYPSEISISDPLADLSTEEFSTLARDEDTLFKRLDAP